MNWKLGCMLGKGSQGEVWMNEDQTCAIKRCPFEYNNVPIVLRELYAFSVFKNVPHVLNMKEWRVNEEKTHIEIALDLYKYNIRTIMETNICSESMIKSIMIQVLRGLANIHARGFIHRDVKPDNILIDDRGHIVIGDFGLMRIDHSQKNKHYQMTLGMQTIWYRAPEMMQNSQGYNSKIDIWSVGVMLVEMICREPVFTGTTEKEQKELYRWLLQENKDSLRLWIEKGGTNVKYTSDVLDFVQTILHFSPEKRFSAEQALSHPWLQSPYEIYTFPTVLLTEINQEHAEMLKSFRFQVDKEQYELTVYIFRQCLPYFQGRPSILLEQASEIAELIEYRQGTSGPYIFCSQTAKIIFGSFVTHCSFSLCK